MSSALPRHAAVDPTPCWASKGSPMPAEARRIGAVVSLAFAFVSSATVAPAWGSCECDAIVEAQGFSFYQHETCSDEGDGDMHPENARAVVLGIQLWRSIPSHPGLASALRRGGVNLIRIGRGPFTDGAATTKQHLPAGLLDSLSTFFASLDRESTVVLFAVQLGAFRSASGATRLRVDLDRLWPAEDGDDPDERDSALTVDWRLSSCVEARRPRLYALPPGPDSLHRVCWGLFVERGDALRAARWIERIEGVRGTVSALEATPTMIGTVLRQSTWRPPNWSVRARVSR